MNLKFYILFIQQRLNIHSIFCNLFILYSFCLWKVISAPKLMPWQKAAAFVRILKVGCCAEYLVEIVFPFLLLSNNFAVPWWTLQSQNIDYKGWPVARPAGQSTVNVYGHIVEHACIMHLGIQVWIYTCGKQVLKSRHVCLFLSVTSYFTELKN